jgi:WD40 repeat protein/serine/threonine protein kinase
MTMAGEPSERHPIDRLAEEFVERYRRGERPSVGEYVGRYPELADQLGEVLRALVLMEELGPGPGGSEGASPGGPAPRHLGDFRLLREVGRGGMGVVYEAVQESLGRRVALKVLPADAWVDPTQRERFRREARAVARLHHTNIVPVFGVGEEGGVHYFAMQFIHGQALDEVLREVRRLRQGQKASPSTSTDGDALAGSLAAGLVSGTLRPPSAGGDAPAAADHPEGQAPPSSSVTLLGQSDSEGHHHYFRSVARIGLQVAEALAYAHGQGVLHRDIKPSNLLLDAQGTVWVTDFGLAKTDAAENLTHTGDIVGTLRYMAPERFNSWSDPRSDVYGLGLTLYELLTLRPAFEDSDRNRLIRQVLEAEPPPPRKSDRRIPPDLETVVLKATTKEPGRRYQTAAELAEDLRRFLADRPIQARRATALGHAWRWCRRNPALAALTTSVAALLLTVAVVASGAALWLRDERNATREQLHLTQEAERLARQRLYEARLAQAQANRGSGRVGQRFESLNALGEAARIAQELGLGEDKLLALRNEAIACMALADVRPVGEGWEGYPPGSELDVVFDPALEHYARFDNQGNLSVRRVAGDVELVRLPGPGTKAGVNPEFSPDGTFLDTTHGPAADGGPWQLRVWDWRRRALVFREPFPDWNGLTFTPDGRRAAVGRTDGTLYLYELPGGQEVRRLSVGLRPDLVAFTPDAAQVAVASRQVKEVQVRDAASGSLVRKLPLPGAPSHLAWQPDGPLLAVGCGRSIYLWDTATGRQHLVVQGHQGLGVETFFAPGGDVLSSQAWDGIGRLWDLASGRQLLSSSCLVRQPYWDGRRLIGGGTSDRGTGVRLWEAALGREYRALPCLLPGETGVHGGAVSPDGRWAAVAYDDGVRLWDLVQAREAAFLNIGRTNAAAFHPSGRELITSGSAGLCRRPLRQDAGTLHLGPPRLLAVPAGVRPLQRVAFDGPGHALAVVGGNAGTVLHLDQARAQTPDLRHDDAVFVAQSPDGGWVATGTWNGYGVRVWDAHTGRPACDPLLADQPDARIATVAFSPDSRWLVTGTGTEFRFWRTGSWTTERRIPRAPEAGHFAVVFSPDRSLMALTTSRAVVQVRDYPDGRLLATLQGPPADTVQPLGFSPDGDRLVVLADGRPRVWDLRLVRTQLADLGLDWDLPPYPPAPAAGSPVRVQVLSDPAAVRRLVAGARAVHGVAFAPDGRRALSAGFDGTVRLWDLAAGTEVRRFRGHTDRVTTVAFSPDGRQALSGGCDQTIRLWDVETGQEVRHWQAHADVVEVVAFSPDGCRALSGGRDRTLRLWDVATGAELRRLVEFGDRVRTVVFSPEGRHALSGSYDRTVRLWDLQTGQEVRRFEGHTAFVRAVALAPDGRRALSGGDDRTLRLWDVATGQQLRAFEGHAEEIEGVAFSPDGRYAVSGGEDGTVRLWDVEQGREVRQFIGHESEVYSVAYSPDGRAALSGSMDGTLRLWDVAGVLREGPGQ